MGWEEPADTAEPPAAAPVAPPPAPVVPAPAPVPSVEPEPLTTEQIIQRTSEATARLMQPAPAPAHKSEPTPGFEMLEEDADDHKVLVYLAANNPRFKGKDAEYLAYLKKSYDYQDKWLAENPGKPFEPESEEHQEWYAANPQPVTKKDMDDGRIEMKAAEAAERMYEQRIAPEKKAREEEQAWNAGLPVLRRNVDNRIVALVDAADPELAKLLKDANGVANLTDATAALVAEADPIAHEILDEIAKSDLVPMIVELEKTAIPGLGFALNPARNAIHAQIDRYRATAEADLKALPSAEQLRNGRQWVTISKINQMRQAINDGPGSEAEKQQKHADLNSSHWSLTVDDLEELIADDLAAVAKQKIDRRNASAKKKYAPTQPAPQPEPQPQPQPQPTPAPSALTRSRPPSLSSGADVVTPAKTGSGVAKSFGEQAAEVHFK